MPAKKTKRWVAKVKTDSTHPPEGLFTKSAATIARTLASKKVSPKGPASGMRMLTYFINRGGRRWDRAHRGNRESANAKSHHGEISYTVFSLEKKTQVATRKMIGLDV